jgi:hypothetical protein
LKNMVVLEELPLFQEKRHEVHNFKRKGVYKPIAYD